MWWYSLYPCIWKALLWVCRSSARVCVWPDGAYQLARSRADWLPPKMCLNIDFHSFKNHPQVEASIEFELRTAAPMASWIWSERLRGSEKRSVQVAMLESLRVIVCAVSFTCTLLLSGGTPAAYIFISYQLNCFCRAMFRGPPLSRSDSCCVLKCFYIISLKFEWYKCKSVTVFGLCALLPIHHRCLLLVNIAFVLQAPWVSGYCWYKKVNGLGSRAFLSDLQLCVER